MKNWRFVVFRLPWPPMRSSLILVPAGLLLGLPTEAKAPSLWDVDLGTGAISLMEISASQTLDQNYNPLTLSRVQERLVWEQGHRSGTTMAGYGPPQPAQAFLVELWSESGEWAAWVGPRSVLPCCEAPERAAAQSVVRMKTKGDELQIKLSPPYVCPQMVTQSRLSLTPVGDGTFLTTLCEQTVQLTATPSRQARYDNWSRHAAREVLVTADVTLEQLSFRGLWIYGETRLPTCAMAAIDCSPDQLVAFCPTDVGGWAIGPIGGLTDARLATETGPCPHMPIPGVTLAR